MGFLMGSRRRAGRVQAASRPADLMARMAPRAALSLGLMAVFLWLLADRLGRIDGQALTLAMWQLGPAQWGQALAFTAISFWAVGRYDAVIHRHFATGVPAARARAAGVAAIAVSQLVGLGVVSGAILRWRMLPGLSLWQATRLTATVALSFLAGWAVVAATVLLIAPGAPFKPAAGLALAGLAALAILSILGPGAHRLPFRWPNGFVLSRLVGLCAVDTIAAALALYALLPQGSDLAFLTLLPAFLLALGAGLALGTPGGMGAFEVTLLALLPPTAEPQLLAAMLAWRLVYYVLPALGGATLAILGPGKEARDKGDEREKTSFQVKDLQAETGLAHQGGLSVEALPGARWLIGRRGHVLFALLDPQTAPSRAALDASLLALHQRARAETRSFAAYKCGPRLAARARALGFAPRRIAWEAWVDPRSYRLGTSSRSGLRRKLRRAEAAGVAVRQVAAEAAPWPALDRIAAAWAAAHGGERGFSMGRHGRDYLSRQRLYLAFAQGQPIAYASFHTTAEEWVLDVMRHGTALPDGTMHSLVQAAIDDAARAGVPRLSLAAVPEAGFGRGDLACRLIAALAPETAATGLMRFKSAFAPRWSPRYLVAAHPAALALAGLSLWRAITRPPPLANPADMPEFEQGHAEYGFASAPGPWHIARERR